MDRIFKGEIFKRENLAGALSQFSRQTVRDLTWEAFVDGKPPARGGTVGSWSTTTGDPLAEILIVRDEDFDETLTWLNSYFSSMSPVTQWCRILSHSEAQRITERQNQPSLENTLGSWVGAILAECSVQSGGIQNLRDMNGLAATTTANFAAGRATAIWNSDADLGKIADRHTKLSQNLRDGTRPLKADSLIPLWSVLRGRMDRKASSYKKALEPLGAILTMIVENADKLEPAELVQKAAFEATDYFELPELLECAQGPQVSRVKALDRLGEYFLESPRSPSIDALLGLAASFIDPGSAVAPELIRRFSLELPVAPIWQGVFAGALHPLRVFTDQGGLGRLIAKALLASSDLKGRPTCDVSYDELIRWITPGRSLRTDLRSMSARVLSVELVHCVTCSFPYGRSENFSAPSSSVPADQPREQQEKPQKGRSLQELDVAVETIQQTLKTIQIEISKNQGNLDFSKPRTTRTKKSK